MTDEQCFLDLMKRFEIKLDSWGHGPEDGNVWVIETKDGDEFVFLFEPDGRFKRFDTYCSNREWD